jgi:hypothetical protein
MSTGAYPVTHKSEALSNPTLKGWLRVSAAERSRAIQLAVVALLSLITYIIVLVQPYTLARWWAYGQRTVAKLARFNLAVGLEHVLAITVLFVLYVWALRAARGRRGVLTWTVVFLGALAFNVALLRMYPVDSNDIFDYIIRARMAPYYNANPLYHTPEQFPMDPFQAYNGWDRVPSAYGPLWEQIASAGARLGGDHYLQRETILSNVFIFKLISVLGYVGTALLIGLILRRLAPQRALLGVVIFAWNPFVLYNAAGNAHNDTVMAFFIVLGFYWLLQGRFTLAALAQVAGALIKFIPALLLPIIVLAAFKRLPTWRQRIGFLLVTGIACALLAAIAYAPYYLGGDAAGIARRGDLFHASIPAVLRHALAPGLGDALAKALVSRLSLVLLAVWLARQLLIVWRSDDLWAPVHASLSLIMFYLLVSVLWFQSWYLIWPLALAALLPGGFMPHLTMLFTFTGMWKMPIFDFLLMRANSDGSPGYWEYRLAPAIVGVPWAYIAVHWARAEWRRLRARLRQPAPKLLPPWVSAPSWQTQPRTQPALVEVRRRRQPRRTA